MIILWTLFNCGLSHPDLYIGSTLDYYRQRIRNLNITWCSQVNYVCGDVSYMLYIVLRENDTENLGTVVIVWTIWTAINLTFLCFRCYLLLWNFIYILSLFCFAVSKHITKEFVLWYIVPSIPERNIEVSSDNRSIKQLTRNWSSGRK